mgnify:CR=1 FL=1
MKDVAYEVFIVCFVFRHFWAGAPAGVNVLSTKSIEPAMAEGIRRAKAQADEMRQFWS